jgi:uncharacterized repeat protein (TIGR02543 family)
MGKADFSCNVSCECVSYDGYKDVLRIHCYWKNNGWTYHMSGIYGWVSCGGSEVCVYNNGYPDFTSSNQGEYELGYSDFTINRGQSDISTEYHARLKSTSSYQSGERTSSSGYYTTGALAHHTVSYNANGGSGAPGSQTKWYGSTLTLSSTKPTRTGYTFQGWATSSSGSVAYSAGGTYSSDSDVTLYAVWKANTWTVSYNANGGSGAPSSQTKTYGVTLTLSSTKPTRTDYNFKGWATSASGAVAYAAGGSYTANAAVTLYAVWELAYVKPRLTSFSAQRCNSGGTASESGTYAKVAFSWATDKTVSAIKIQHKLTTASSWTDTSVTASGTSGSVSQVIGSNGLSAESTYLVRAYVSDSDGTTYSSEISLGTTKYPIDVKSGGKGVAFGKVSEKEDAVELGFNQLWLGGIKVLWYS